MSTWEDQFRPARDLDHDGPPSRRYVIASTPRCGSHLLGQLLASTGAHGDPLEYFNRANLRRWAEHAERAGEDVRTHVERRRTTPNGVFGMKLHVTQVEAALRHYGAAELFEEADVVWLRREDVVAQAVSLSVARQTGAWISAVKREREPAYDGAAITRALADLVDWDARWRALLALRGRQPLVVTFEELTADPRTTGATVAEALADGGSSGWERMEVATRRQSTARTSQWRERYLREHGLAGDVGDDVALALAGEGEGARRGAARRLRRLAGRALTALPGRGRGRG